MEKKPSNYIIGNVMWGPQMKRGPGHVPLVPKSVKWKSIQSLGVQEKHLSWILINSDRWAEIPFCHPQINERDEL